MYTVFVTINSSRRFFMTSPPASTLRHSCHGRCDFYDFHNNFYNLLVRVLSHKNSQIKWTHKLFFKRSALRLEYARSYFQILTICCLCMVVPLYYDSRSMKTYQTSSCFTWRYNLLCLCVSQEDWVSVNAVISLKELFVYTHINISHWPCILSCKSVFIFLIITRHAH